MLRKLINKFRNSSLVKGSLWYTVGNILLKGISIITMPIFTRILRLSDYGMISVYSTWLGIYGCVIGLQVNSSIGTAKYDYKDDYNSYISSIMFLGILNFIPIFIISLLFNNVFTVILQLPHKLYYILIIQALFSFIIELKMTELVFANKYKRYLLISFCNTILNVLLSIALILNYREQRYFGRIYGGFIITIAFGLIIFLYNIRREKITLKLSYWKYAISLSIPIVPNTLSQIILTQIDRVMINKFINSSAAGMYSFAYNIGMLLNLLWVSINNAWVPWFYNKMDNKEYEEINLKSKYYIIFFSFITFLLIFLSPEIVKLLANKRYWSSIGLVPIIILSYYFVFLYSFSINVECYMKKNKFIPIATVLSGVINIILNYYLIPVFGYYIAAWNTLISYFTLFLFHYILSIKLCNIKIVRLRYYILGILSMMLSTFLFYLFQNTYLIRYMGVVIVTLLSFLYVYKSKVFAED